MILFSQELEHTQMYLELEKMRFGESLQVTYDLECTEFIIPTLTLQPLVENAVRHGVRGNPDGKGTVTISSREEEAHYLISVSDDGPGFDTGTKNEDGRSHIGIDNVRERLRTICGGDLEIESRAGEGTKATILLPKAGKEIQA
jgi:sensor histidine kinase YesM